MAFLAGQNELVNGLMKAIGLESTPNIQRLEIVVPVDDLVHVNIRKLTTSGEIEQVRIVLEQANVKGSL